MQKKYSFRTMRLHSIVFLAMSIMLLGTIPTGVKAESPLSILVLDTSTDLPIANAHVTIITPNGNAINSGTTPGGETWFWLTTDASYTIFASANNYQPKGLEYSFSADNHDRTIMLTPSVDSTPKVWMYPTSGPAGTTIAIHGYNFASKVQVGLDWEHSSGQIFTSEDDGSFITAFTIPASAIPGPHKIEITSAITGYSGNNIFTVTNPHPAPAITLNQHSGPAGTEITITGQGFSNNEYLQLQWDMIELPVYFIANVTGEFSTTWTIPLNTALGSHTVEVFDALGGAATASTQFTVTPPVISLTPSLGPAGAIITITGHGFSSHENLQLQWDTTELAVYFAADANGEISTTWTTPLNAELGSHSVEVFDALGGTVSAPTTFTVTAPTITMNPSMGPAGTKVSITGQGFSSHENLQLQWDITELPVYFAADANGEISTTWTTPLNAELGSHTLAVFDATGGSAFALATFTISSPVISLNPSSGPAGTMITITGYGFSSHENLQLQWDINELAVYFTADANGVVFTTWKAPSDAQLGSHTVEVFDALGGAATASTQFTVTAPVISLNPSSGPAGTVVTISGHGFSSHENLQLQWDINELAVYFTADANGDISITWTVPLNAELGSHSVGVFDALGGSAFASSSFAVSSPTISLNPSSGPAGTVITITGRGFSSFENLQLQYDTTELAIYFAADVNGEFSTTWTVPLNTQLGSHAVAVFDALGKPAFASTPFITTSPSISLNPSTGPAGTTITITGHGFSSHENLQLQWDMIELAVFFAADANGEISATWMVPLNAALGSHSLAVLDALGGSGFASTSFIVASPTIIASPSSGPAGSVITITGHGFSSHANLQLQWDMTELAIYFAADTNGDISITWAIPLNAELGSHVVEVFSALGGSALASATYTINPPAISLNPSSGPAGTVITITGQGFSGHENLQLQWDITELAVHFSADANGKVSTTWTIPLNTALGSHTVEVFDALGGAATASTQFTVKSPVIALNPSSGPKGTVIIITGHGFSSHENLQLQWDTTELAVYFAADANGEISTTWTTPLNAELGSHTLAVFDATGGSAFATASYTVTEVHTIISTTTNAVGHTATVDHSTQTGIKVFITGSTLTEDQTITVNTINYGPEKPAETGLSFGDDALFYDAQVLLSTGTSRGQEVFVSLSISNPAFVDGSLIYYWNGVIWQQANNQQYDAATHTISGMVTANDLSGTPLMVTKQTLLITTPEYPIGALMAIILCFASLIVYKNGLKSIKRLD